MLNCVGELPTDSLFLLKKIKRGGGAEGDNTDDTLGFLYAENRL